MDDDRSYHLNRSGHWTVAPQVGTSLTRKQWYGSVKICSDTPGVMLSLADGSVVVSIFS
jgi:hypothetical protein